MSTNHEAEKKQRMQEEPARQDKEPALDVGVSDERRLRNELDTPFPLSADQCRFYQENGYIKLAQVLSAELLAHYRDPIRAIVAERSANKPPLDQRSTYDKAFLQIENLWCVSEVVRELAFSRRLAQIATDLMGCRGVRIYHDQALCKEPGGGITPWHADQYYFPLDSDNVVTAWIPLQRTPIEMGPLAFCEKSHRVHVGRDLEISDESETTLRDVLRQFTTNESPFELGDISFHAGWTFHRAGANTTGQQREVMTMIYVDEDIRLTEPKNKGQRADREQLCPGLAVGDVLDAPLTPVLFTH